MRSPILKRGTVPGAEKTPPEGTVRIGLDFPRWFPSVLRTPARLAIGIFIGLQISAYCVALALITNRILVGLMVGTGPFQQIYQLVSLAGLVVGGMMVHSALVRFQHRGDTAL